MFLANHREQILVPISFVWSEFAFPLSQQGAGAGVEKTQLLCWFALGNLPAAFPRGLFLPPDKTLSVAIEGSVDEAKALFKPPEDSQGNMVIGIPHPRILNSWTDAV